MLNVKDKSLNIKTRAKTQTGIYDRHLAGRAKVPTLTPSITPHSEYHSTVLPCKACREALTSLTAFSLNTSQCDFKTLSLGTMVCTQNKHKNVDMRIIWTTLLQYCHYHCCHHYQHHTIIKVSICYDECFLLLLYHLYNISLSIL